VKSTIERLQKVAAPELNFLLTERPRLIDGEYDLGWYCREHAFCTVIISALLGMVCHIVRGDFLIRTKHGFRLGSIGAAHDHAWCQTDDTPVLDLSLHFRRFGSGPQIAEPIVQLGRNGVFDVRVLPATTEPFSDFGDDAIIGYIPRTVFQETASQWLDSPLPFLRSAESSAIAIRIALHVFDVVTGTSRSLAGTMTQLDGLSYLRQKFPDAVANLRELLEEASQQ
jgi:hypothetical protein